MLVIFLLFCSLCKSVYGLPNTGQNKKSESYVPCDEGWYFFGQKCYTIGGDDDPVTWVEAVKRCTKMGGELASIHSETQTEFFTTFLTRDMEKYVWIGLNDRDSESKYRWQDGSPLDFNNWRDDEPNNHNNEDCVELIYKPSVGKIGWNDVDCELKFAYICQKNMNAPPFLTTAAQRMKCPDFPNGWKDIGGEFCYFIEIKHKLTWYKAQEECIERGGTLAAIHSQEEERMLEPFVKPLGSLFIGLSNLLTDGSRYVWSDGSQLKYTNWAQGEPNSRYERCVQIAKRSMSWRDVSCNSKSAFMCQVKKVPVKTTADVWNVGDTEGIIEIDEVMRRRFPFY